MMMMMMMMMIMMMMMNDQMKMAILEVNTALSFAKMGMKSL